MLLSILKRNENHSFFTPLDFKQILGYPKIPPLDFKEPLITYKYFLFDSQSEVMNCLSSFDNLYPAL